MNAYRNGFMISKDCKNIEKAYEIWEYASDPIKALEINNGSRRGLLWEFVDENNEYLPADATIEDIAAHGFKYLMKEFDKDCPEGCTHEKDAALIEDRLRMVHRQDLYRRQYPGSGRYRSPDDRA